MFVIEKGDRGPDVVAWQEFLIQQGFPLPQYGADGDFGTPGAGSQGG